jgi:hypothetical protein
VSNAMNYNRLEFFSTILFVEALKEENNMSLHEDYEDDHNFSDYSYEDDKADSTHRRNVRRILEEKLERKRLKEEFKDEFDELNDEFDWDLLEK